MWDNIGRKLQSLAKVLCWLGILGSLIWAIVIWMQSNRYQSTVLTGILYLVIGSVLSWIGSWALYGLGIVVEYVEEGGSAKKLTPLIFSANKAESTTKPSFAEPAKETERIQVKSINTDSSWKEDGDHFVRCPGCNCRMSIDFIKARKKCPDCGTTYTVK